MNDIGNHETDWRTLEAGEGFRLAQEMSERLKNGDTPQSRRGFKRLSSLLDRAAKGTHEIIALQTDFYVPEDSTTFPLREQIQTESFSHERRRNHGMNSAWAGMLLASLGAMKLVTLDLTPRQLYAGLILLLGSSLLYARHQAALYLRFKWESAPDYRKDLSPLYEFAISRRDGLVHHGGRGSLVPTTLDEAFTNIPQGLPFPRLQPITGKIWRGSRSKVDYDWTIEVAHDENGQRLLRETLWLARPL